MALNARQLQASRAILQWAAKTRRMLWSEYNELMRDVVACEKALIGCVSKEGFSSYELANRVAQRPGKEGRRHLHVFKCARCGMFHLASVDPRGRSATLRLRAKKLEVTYG